MKHLDKTKFLKNIVEYPIDTVWVTAVRDSMNLIEHIKYCYFLKFETLLKLLKVKIVVTGLRLQPRMKNVPMATNEPNWAR